MIRLTTLLAGLVLIAISSVAVSPTAIAASSKPDKTTRVIIAEDKTQEAACVHWINVPSNTMPCPPGTVIVSRETTYAEVLRSGTTDYIILTGDVSQDSKLREDLVERVLNRLQPSQASPLSTQSCTPHSTTTLGQSSTLQGVRFSEEVSYSLQSTCAITNIVDHAKADVDNQLAWQWSKNTDSAQVNRTLALYTVWSAWYSLPNSGKGQRHLVNIWHYNSNTTTTVSDTYF